MSALFNREIGLAFLSILLLASQSLGSRTVLADSGVLASQALRLSLASLILLAIYRAKVWSDLNVKGCVLGVGAAIVGVVLGSVFNLRGVGEAGPEIRFLVVGLVPLLIYLINIIVKQDSFNQMKAVGFGLGLAAYISMLYIKVGGLGIIADSGSGVVAATCIAGGFVGVGYALKDVSPAALATVYLGVAGGILLFLSQSQIPEIFSSVMDSAEHVLYFAFDIIVCVTLGYFLLFQSIHKLGVTKIAAMLMLVPIVQNFVGFVWWDEQVTTQGLIAAGVVTIGTFLVLAEN